MSSQGLSYKGVVLVLDGFESITWFGRQEITNMIYMSVTRATHELMLVSMDENVVGRRYLFLAPMPLHKGRNIILNFRKITMI